MKGFITLGVTFATLGYSQSIQNSAASTNVETLTVVPISTAPAQESAATTNENTSGYTDKYFNEEPPPIDPAVDLSDDFETVDTLQAGWWVPKRPEFVMDNGVKVQCLPNTYTNQEFDGYDLSPVASYERASDDSYAEPGEIDDDIMKMVEGMTLEQKAGQMLQIETGAILGCDGLLNRTYLEEIMNKYYIGSFLETPSNRGHRYNWLSPEPFSDFTDAVQEIAMKSGSKIPLLYGMDSVHGAGYVKGATLFPHSVGTGATFNPKMAEATGRIAAKDSRAVGCNWVFGPLMDINAEKIWARTYENYGEDPLLTSKMAVAALRGLQGNYKKDRDRVAATMKHFLGYTKPFNGQDKSSRQISDRELFEFHLPPFEAAVKAGVATCMEAYSDINGEDVVASSFYLNYVLREYLGFKGMTISDWSEINNQLFEHRTASSFKQAHYQSLRNTTIDMSMTTNTHYFFDDVIEFVNKGLIPISRIDESVRKILQIKKDIGLFESPYVDRSLIETVGSAQDIELSRNSARESITMLQNKRNTLPLKKEENILFVGPTINSTRYMAGGWSMHHQGPSEAEGDLAYQGFGDTIMLGVEKILGEMPDFYEGCDILGNYKQETYDSIVRMAQRADKVVIGLGEPTYAESLADIDTLALYQGQVDLVTRIAQETGKPIVVLLIQGRSRTLGKIPDMVDSILNCYLPGPYAGLPIAEVLYGEVNPSGRQSFTYPRMDFQHTTVYWQGVFNEYDPQWAFGAGFGYSNITYSNVTVSADTVRRGEPIDISVSLTNNGPYDQMEPVLMFTSQLTRGHYTPELARLRDFTKVPLIVGETVDVKFTLTAEEMMFFDRDLVKTLEGGKVRIAINNFQEPESFAVVDLR